jgi:geranylgeranyl diphosphate synthase type I
MTEANHQALMQSMLTEVEAVLRRSIAYQIHPESEELHEMLSYHMGWSGAGAGVEASGKRLRPLILLLANASAGGNWRAALPAAAAVELIHNFSLIHDDIQDDSPLRRGRPTLWKVWGIPQAINAGDALFTQAHLAMLQVAKDSPPAITLRAVELLQETCLHLTQGQYLDIAYEKRSDLTVEMYWQMVRGKTAALLAACAQIGALIARADQAIIETYRIFGESLGLAFQVQDDLLGIWGDPQVTGKSAQSDLISGKKSLPILFGLAQQGAFMQRWQRGAIAADEAAVVAGLLEQDGGKAFAERHSDKLTAQALQALASAQPQGEAGDVLRELASRLLRRQA